MRTELKRIHREVRSTTMYVTHDQVEALGLGERIAILQRGRVVQQDTPSRIYDRPANRFVGGFIGNPPMNFLDGRAGLADGRPVVEIGGRPVALPQTVAPGPVLVGIRPEHISVSLQPGVDGIAARVVVLEPLGPQTLLTVEVDRQVVKVSVAPEFRADPDTPIWLRLDPARIRLMDARTGDALPG